MLSHYKYIDFGYVLLAVTLVVSVGFSYWLLAESEAEQVTRFYRQYERLTLEGKLSEARELHNRVLSTGDSEELGEIWLPLVQAQEDGYDKLSNYLRILAGNTQREATYNEIADLIARAPESFLQGSKSDYIEMLNEIPFVAKELLGKYGLLK